MPQGVVVEPTAVQASRTFVALRMVENCDYGCVYGSLLLANQHTHRA